jgi:hypothetical protein
MCFTLVWTAPCCATSHKLTRREATFLSPVDTSTVHLGICRLIHVHDNRTLGCDNTARGIGLRAGKYAGGRVVATMCRCRPVRCAASWNEPKVLRQRQHDRHLKETRRFWVDDFLAVGGKETGDLFLSAPTNRRLQRDRTAYESYAAETEGKLVGVFQQPGVFTKGQIVAVEGGSVGKVARTQNGRRVWIRTALVPSRELVDHRFGRDADKGGSAEMRRVRHGTTRLPHPLCVLDHLLDLDCARHSVDHW